MFLSLIPVSAALCRTSFLQSFLTSTFRLGLNTLGARSLGAPTLIQGGSKEALKLLVFASGFNALVTYALAPGLSIMGQAMSTGYLNKGAKIGLDSTQVRMMMADVLCSTAQSQGRLTVSYAVKVKGCIPPVRT